MLSKVVVVGAGSWGTTIADLAAERVTTTLVARDLNVAVKIDQHHENHRYLPGHGLTPTLRATNDLEAAVADADLVLLGVPCAGIRAIAARLAESLAPTVPIVSLAKGFEHGSSRRMSEVIHEECPRNPVGALTGPNLAKEIAARKPAAAVVASADAATARAVQDLLTSAVFRVYTNTDIIGCELGGALKNVVALAVGIAEGLGTGDNARAALVTRGLAEMTRLGTALGGRPETFAGLTGIGDLVATCLSGQSRNHRAGLLYATGCSTAEVLEQMTQVAEGIHSVSPLCALAGASGVELPVCEAVRSVVIDGADAALAGHHLLARPIAAE